MPTFKNETKHYIDYERNGKLVRFEPDEERGLPFWLPYNKLGLTLINSEYPVVKNKILISGEFDFNKDMERLFNIEECDKYTVKIDVAKGKCSVYPGNLASGTEIKAGYSHKIEIAWEIAPYLKVIGLEDGTVVEIYAEAD